MTEPNLTGNIPRPKQLKGLLNSAIKLNLLKTMCVTLTIGCIYHVFYQRKRKENYAKFYANLDCQASYDRMNAAGVMQSGDNWKNYNN